MTIHQAVQEMLLAVSPACRAKAAPYARAILEGVDEQEKIILHLALLRSPTIELIAAPANAKFSDA